MSDFAHFSKIIAGTMTWGRMGKTIAKKGNDCHDA